MMRTADQTKLLIAFGLAGLAMAFCVVSAFVIGKRPVYDILICIAGFAIGWSLGLYLTPASEGEKKILSDGTKTVLTLLAGVGLGKAGQLSEKLQQWVERDDGPFQMLLFFCTLIVGTLCTYAARLFWTGADEELKKARLKAIKDARTALDKLEASNG